MVISSRNKIYLTETVVREGYPDYVPVTLITEGGVEMDGYLTESDVARVMSRAESAGKVRFVPDTPKRIRLLSSIQGFVSKLFAMLLCIILVSSCATPGADVIQGAMKGLQQQDQPRDVQANANTNDVGIQLSDIRYSSVTILQGPSSALASEKEPERVAQAECMDIPRGMEVVEEQIKEDEGLRLEPYGSEGSIHIGYGRNLSGKGISPAEAEFLFANDLAEVREDLTSALPDWPGLPFEIQAVLVQMRYQLGPSGFRDFEGMIQAVKDRDWSAMAAEMRDSHWYRVQTPERAERLVRQVDEFISTHKDKGLKP